MQEVADAHEINPERRSRQRGGSLFSHSKSQSPANRQSLSPPRSREPSQGLQEPVIRINISDNNHLHQQRQSGNQTALYNASLIGQEGYGLNASGFKESNDSILSQTFKPHLLPYTFSQYPRVRELPLELLPFTQKVRLVNMAQRRNLKEFYR